MAKPQISIIGAGIFVKTQYIPRLFEISDLVSLKSIWSRSQDSAISAVDVARKTFPGVEAKWGDDGLEDIIQDTSILAVAVVLAGQIQVDMSLKLLKAGKHVIQGIDEAEIALQSYKSITAGINGSPIWAVAENYRFETAFTEGKKLVADLGNLMSVQVIVEGSMNSSNPYFSSSWRRDFTGGFILDMGVHMIAGLRMLVGCELTSVSALTSHVDVSLPPPDNISSTFLLENGCPGVFVMSIFWRVVGMNGTVQVERSSVDGRHGYMVSSYNAEGKCTSSFYSFCGVTEELKAFIHDISEVSLKKVTDHQAEARLSYIEGVRDVAILEAMLDSGSKQGVNLPVRIV
ncbi:hypothetical protein V2J09_018474 [Rumex salicifolius]